MNFNYCSKLIPTTNANISALKASSGSEAGLATFEDHITDSVADVFVHLSSAEDCVAVGVPEHVFFSEYDFAVYVVLVQENLELWNLFVTHLPFQEASYIDSFW